VEENSEEVDMKFEYWKKIFIYPEAHTSSSSLTNGIYQSTPSKKKERTEVWRMEILYIF